MTMDAQLVEVALAAEGGHEFPELALVVGSVIVTGSPVASSTFLEAVTRAVGQGHWKDMDGRERKRRQGDGGMDDLWAQIAATLAPLTKPIPDKQILTLAPAQVVIGERAVKLPAIRIPIDCVQTWWLPSTGEESKPSSGFFGLFVPLNLPN